MSQKESEEQNLLNIQIELVIDYLEDSGVAVEFGGKINGYFYEDDVITITNNQSLTSKFYTLLHEAGHFLLKNRDDRFVQPDRRNMTRLSQARRVKILHEEFLAWDEGLKLAKELNLYIDQKQWERVSYKHLYDYVKWSHKPLEFKKENASERR